MMNEDEEATIRNRLDAAARIRAEIERALTSIRVIEETAEIQHNAFLNAADALVNTLGGAVAVGEICVALKRFLADRLDLLRQEYARL